MKGSNLHKPLEGVASRSGNCFTIQSRAYRLLWNFAYALFFRPSPRPFHFWRRWMLRAFGAKIAGPARIYPNARIWWPAHLVIRGRSGIADEAWIYNVAPVEIGHNVVISQQVMICTASHDYTIPGFPLIASSIRIDDEAWLAARCFVHPGVSVGRGCIVGACSVVVKSLLPWGVYAGNPAIKLKDRQPIHSKGS
ncbi:MAG: putative colanic acid biosynthesis acetyltransferase [Cyanobium sp.]